MIRYIAADYADGRNGIVVTGWHDNMRELIQTLGSPFCIRSFNGLRISKESILTYMKRSAMPGCEEYTVSMPLWRPATPGFYHTEAYVRYLAVYDSFGRMYTPEKVLEALEEESEKVMAETRYKSRNKMLREKDSGFRREPVSYTGRNTYGCSRGWSRNISYKHTRIAAEENDYAEYGVRPAVRAKTVLDVWDIEPVRHVEKSWKKNSKAGKQWMVKAGSVDRKSIRYMRRQVDYQAVEGWPEATTGSNLPDERSLDN